MGKKIHRASGTCGTVTRDLTFGSSKSQKEKRKKTGLEKHAKK